MVRRSTTRFSCRSATMAVCPALATFAKACDRLQSVDTVGQMVSSLPLTPEVLWLGEKDGISGGTRSQPQQSNQKRFDPPQRPRQVNIP